MLTLIVVGLALSLLVALVARVRGRSGMGWFVLSLFVTPLLAGAILLLLDPARA
ncbi:MAG TPA: hypothetical protein VF190_16005 [Rhodothermales bacterium]